MPPRTPPEPRPAPDLLPDSLPGRTDSDVLPDGPARDSRPETTPDSLPRVDDNTPIEGRGSRVVEAERESWFEHPEGSAPPLDRLTQDDKPETAER